MPSLVIENVPSPLFDQIQCLATARKRTAAETALEVLGTAFHAVTPTHSSTPPPGEPFLTDEEPAPFDIPRPEGVRVVPQWIADYAPEPHHIPDED
jgi:hypothetical protein